MSRGFGVAATGDEELHRAVAQEAEAARYGSIWVNDTPSADGLLAAKWMQDVTHSIPVGVGVVPLDRRPAADTAQTVERLGLDPRRLILGLGSGFASNPQAVVAAGVDLLRSELPGLTLGVAAMGARMCTLAGRIADVVVLNWMDPHRIAWAKDKIFSGAEGRNDSGPRVAAYIRAAIGHNSGGRLRLEQDNYGALPHYARHFSAMGAEGPVGVAVDHPSEPVSLYLHPYEQALDLPIVRALPAEPGPSSVLEILRWAAPA